jgi:MutL protein
MSTQPYPDRGQSPAQKQSTAPVNSLLVADCGAVFTKVSLFGLVEGQYRLMARGETPTTLESPQGDITAGIIQAINVIEMITGRHFVENGHVITPEGENGDGVDVFISTISAGGPLRVAVLGAVSPNLEGLASQSLSGLYAEMQTLSAPSYLSTTSAVPVSVGANMGRPSSPNGWTPERITREWERQLEHMREVQPQATLIVGMADGPAGPNPLQEACQLLTNFAKQRQEMAGADSKRISVLYAGAPQYIEAVRRMLGNTADVTRVDPLTSQSQVGQISVASGALHERNVLKQLPGYEKLSSWSSTSPVATATSLSSLVRFLAQHYSMNVTAVDVGGSTTTLMLAGEQGEFIPTVNTRAGMGAGLGAILQQVGLQRITRWLPFSISEDEIRQFVLNHTMHPQAIPANARELQIIYAFAREAMLMTAEISARNGGGWPTTDLVLGTGGVLSHAPKFGQVAMLLLDALQPKGITSLILDRTMLIPLLGAVASVSPITAVQVNENDAVAHRLGTCVIPFGNLPPGQPAVRVGLEYSNGRQVTVEVMTGSIEVIPLALNEQALLTLFPAPMVDVGLGPGERARAAEEIDGGLVGLIIDARGRPLQLPTNDMERRARLTQWSQALGA